jgi:hypothetical protein
MRREIELGGRHVAAFDDGVVDVRYDGEVDDSHARRLMILGNEWNTGKNSVWCSDVTKLAGFTAAARKVMSSPMADAPAAIEGGSDTHLFISGATIKTKAVLSLVMAATRLLGTIRYHTTYCDTHEEALRLAKAKIAQLARDGLAVIPSEPKRG